MFSRDEKIVYITGEDYGRRMIGYVIKIYMTESDTRKVSGYLVNSPLYDDEDKLKSQASWTSIIGSLNQNQLFRTAIEARICAKRWIMIFGHLYRVMKMSVEKVKE